AGFGNYGKCVPVVAAVVALLHERAETRRALRRAAGWVVEHVRGVIGKARGDLEHIAESNLRRAIDEPFPESILPANAELAAIKIIVSVETILRIKDKAVVSCRRERGHDA